jgi:NhaP-type Na+/H+ or K+/H+ antiporter
LNLLWAMGGGLPIGALCGALTASLVSYLRTRHRLAVGLDEFLSLGLVTLAYGAAQLCLASGFLAVFAAGLALRRVKKRPRPETPALGTAPSVDGHGYAVLATHSDHASAAMTHAVLGFNEQLEKLAELAIVLLVGALMPYAAPSLGLWWFIPLPFFGLRPLAVFAGTPDLPTTASRRAMVSWFGFRGIGSVFHLMFALLHGVTGSLVRELITLTLLTVAVSIVVHGMSVRPLMAGTRDAKRRVRETQPALPSNAQSSVRSKVCHFSLRELVLDFDHFRLVQ